jgi:hypothetical protein
LRLAPRKISLRRTHQLTSVAFGATAGPQEEGVLLCSIDANLGPVRGSSVGILQRMPKPGSFASISCTQSEHLRARPKHPRLPRKGLPTGLGLADGN